ncbi:GTP-binding protein ERG [Cajanus cajan]|uniref:GTP-binding protein ERG n=1 Tax=Cajanus cajan TaxID=3821 RepID=A0A151QVA6_CAJCA|nr:GTP-binding protein ERG [Cajanus cajan]KYP34183.1 GTP-binding protein ERG [Cajanus cajan]
MKALRTLRRTLYSPTPVFRAFFSAQAQAQAQAHEDPTTSAADSDAVFDSSRYALHHDTKPTPEPGPTWDEKYRARADRVVFGEDGPKGKLRLKEEEDERRRRALAKALLEAAVDDGDDEEAEGKGAAVVNEEDQKSLAVGIIGAPNAGKSALTNYMVGTKVAAVSRKTNTTTHEVVGVLTKGDTQIVSDLCLYHLSQNMDIF